MSPGFRFSRQFFLVIILLLLSFAGSGIIALMTRGGLALYDEDSVAYLLSASNLAQGKGLSVFSLKAELRPLVDYPPLYPVILSVFFLLKLDPLVCCRWLAVFLSGMGVFACGWLVHRMRPASFWLPAAASLLFLSNASVCMVYGAVMTEPLFIVLSLASLILLVSYVEKRRMPGLMLCAAVTALAFLSRFSGVALVATGVAAILSSEGSLRDKARAAALFILVSCLPMALWLAGNRFAGGAFISRELIFHPRLEMHELVSSVSRWFLPFPLWRYGHAAFVFIAAGAVMAGLFMRQKERRMRLVVSMCAVFIAAYVSFLVVSAVFFDATIQLYPRHLAPLFPAFALIVLGTVSSLLESMAGKWKRVVSAVLVVLAGVYVVACIRTLPLGGRSASRQLMKKNQHFNEYVGALPADSVIFSNDASWAYRYSRRWTIRLPGKYLKKESAVNSHFAESIEKIGRLAAARPVYMVFYASEQGKQLPGPEEISGYCTLRLVFEDQGQRVYKAGN